MTVRERFKRAWDFLAKSSEDSSVHDEVVSWFLYSSVLLVGFVGADAVLMGEKLADFFAYALPCLAGICVGANLVRKKSERSIWIISVIFLLVGFNFFLTTLPNSEFYFAAEAAISFNVLVFTLVIVLRNQKPKNDSAEQSRPKRTLAATLAVMACVVPLLIYTLKISSSFHRTTEATEAAWRAMEKRELSKHPKQNPKQTETQRNNGEKNFERSNRSFSWLDMGFSYRGLLPLDLACLRDLSRP